jgi:hypothetical protein
MLHVYFASPNSGGFSGSEIRLGSRGDSYYGKIIIQQKQLITQEAICVYLELTNDD